MTARTPPHIATLVTLAALSALNMNLFLPSLPAIARALEADYALVSVSVSGYLAVTAITQVLAGPISDRYGRRPVILVGVAVFVLASIGAALAQDIAAFLGFRMLGAGVATGMSLGRAALRDLHGPERAASMIGYVTMGMAIAPMIGPALGGVIDETLGWRANFWALTLCGVAALALCWVDFGETHAGGDSVARQFRSWPALLRLPLFWAYALAAALSSGGFFAFLGGSPWLADHRFGLSPSAMGAWFGVISVGYALGNYLSGRYAQRFGLTAMSIAGAATALGAVLLSALLFALGAEQAAALYGPVLAMGVGNGLTLPSAMAGQLSARPDLAGSASGLGGAMMVGGGAVFSAAAGAAVETSAGIWGLLAIMAASLAASLASGLWAVSLTRAALRRP